MNAVTEQFLNVPTGLFTHTDVALAMPGSDDSRHGKVKRALASGEIVSIRRGLYTLARPYRRYPINLYALAQRVHGPSYVSMESALSYHGWIPEAVRTCTNASLGNAKTFQTPIGRFTYERVPQRVFYTAVERLDDGDLGVALMATPAKALVDYYYVRRPSWSTIRDAAGSLRIEPEDLSQVSMAELDELAENYRNRRVLAFLADWKETLAQ